MESPVSKSKLLAVVLLCCSFQHAQLPPGQSTASKLSPRAAVMVCCNSNAGCHRAATLSADTAKRFAEAVQLHQAKPRRGTVGSLQTHPLQEFPAVQLLATAEEKGLMFLCPIARLRIILTLIKNPRNLAVRRVRPATRSVIAPALGVRSLAVATSIPG